MLKKDITTTLDVFSGDDLRGRDLRMHRLVGRIDGTDFSGADLRGACLIGCRGAAKFDGADIRGMDFLTMNLVGSSFSQVWIDARVPRVRNLERRILKIVETGKGRVDMSTWYICDTVHCLGGWAIHFAGEAGRRLAQRMLLDEAARLIYIASTGFYPNFFEKSSQRALHKLRARVGDL